MRALVWWLFPGVAHVQRRHRFISDREHARLIDEFVNATAAILASFVATR